MLQERHNESISHLLAAAAKGGELPDTRRWRHAVNGSERQLETARSGEAQREGFRLCLTPTTCKERVEAWILRKRGRPDKYLADTEKSPSIAPLWPAENANLPTNSSVFIESRVAAPWMTLALA